MKTEVEEETLQGSSSVNAVFSNVFWKFAERILAQGLSFVISLVLARILLPDDYGAVAIVLVFIAFADVFVVSGFSASLIQKKDADETDFSTIFYCGLAVSIVLYLMVFSASEAIANFFNMPILSSVLKVFALRIPLSSFNSVQHAYVSRHMMFKKFFFSTLFGTIFSGAAGIIFAVKGFGVWALVIQYLTNSCVDSIVLAFTIYWHPKLLFSWKAAKSLMSYGWKILASSFLGVFFYQLRNILIGKFYTSSELAYYNKGHQFPSLVANNISTSIMSVLFPLLSNKSDDIATVKTMLRRSVQVSSYAMYPLLFGMATIAEPMVLVLLTEKWLPAVPFVQILCVSSAIELIDSISVQGLNAIGESGAVLKLELIKKPVYFMLLVLGLKKGVLAVALSLLINSVYIGIVHAGALKLYVGYRFRELAKDLLPASALSLISCGICWFAKLLPIPRVFALFVQILAAMTIYILLSKILRVESYKYLLDFAVSRTRKGELHR
ncbi:MAG: lipopolysaccharide biosynthesis protein [Treponema sp.]|nr:lipopolysaccharide biosynthesis protein [Treponema sp.]